MISFGRLLWIVSALVCLVLLVSACAAPPSPSEGSDEPAGTEPADTGRPVTLPAPTETRKPPTVESGTAPPAVRPVSPQPLQTAAPGVVVDEVPEDLLAAIIADAASRSGIDPTAFTVVRAEAVTWSDGSLGCPQPGMMYTQALVEGYRVVLEAGGREFDYHAAQSGYFILCEGSQLEPLGAPAGEPGLSPDQ